MSTTPAPIEFAVWMYHPTEGGKIVRSPAEADSLAERGWGKHPHPKKDQPISPSAASTGNPATDARIADLTAQVDFFKQQFEEVKGKLRESLAREKESISTFNSAWDELQAKHAAAESRIAELEAKPDKKKKAAE